MECCIILAMVIVVMTGFKTSNATNRFDVPTFHVGSNLLGKNTHCPCVEVNSTFHRGCGVTPKVNGMNLTDNGTHFGEFPWQVAIIEKYEEEFVCSGVLISPRVVLTAAQCVQEIPVSQIKVRLGEWDILSEDKNPFETYGSVDIQVSKKYLTTETRTQSETYNLAILKLISAINFDEYPHVAPICLPQITTGKANLSDCMVTGWIESGVLKLEKLIETYVGNWMSHAVGMWSYPLEVATSSPEYLGDSNCHLVGGDFGEQVHCSPELSGILGNENRDQHERDYIFDSESMNNEDETDGRMFSRILSKSRAVVLSRAECMKVMKETNSTQPKSNQLCVAAKQGSSPCMGDIGSPVICRVVEEKKQILKEMRRNDETSARYVVVGIITQLFNCRGNSSPTNIRPLLATSISKSLDQICHVMSSS